MHHLRSALENILYSEDDFARITSGIQSMYEQFSQETQIYAGDLTHENMMLTPHGKVVTPVQAAHCVKDIARTTHFLRALHQAIEHYLELQPHVRILYAGCGPYATLLTPFTSLYTPDQLRMIFLEINTTSLEAVHNLYRQWNLMSYLDDLRLADATQPDLNFPSTFDIVVSETMQTGLRYECQVPITRNLVRFLSPGGTFIPQSIQLDVALASRVPKAEHPADDQPDFTQLVYDFDFRALPQPGASVEVDLPVAQADVLQLYTTIHLFGTEKLTAYQSGLTMPLTLDVRLPRHHPIQKTKFWYDEGPLPGLRFEYVTG